MEKRNFSNKVITKLIRSSGEVLSIKCEILNYCAEYYQELYLKKGDTNSDFLNTF